VDGAALAERIATARDGTAAWRQLLGQWRAPAGLSFECRPVVAPGLYCLRGTSGLDRLVAQGRPVLLNLRDGTHEGWALLRGADAVRVRLAFDGAAVDVDRLVLARYWSGDYIALWRAPEDFARVLPRDATGPAVDWVRERLAYAGPAVLDAAMADAVRRFQLDRGLDADGLVGPETLMALAAGDAGPRLPRDLD
jgi:general secretion pathway protein A